MANPITSSSIESKTNALKPRDAKLIVRLHSIWRKHQAEGIKVRHTIGMLLNERLGPPGNRQRYAGAVITAVASELGIDETNICRFRRFADKFADYSGFSKEYPRVNSWTQVRKMLKQSRKSVSGNRRAWGLVRSLKAAVESLKLPTTLDSSRAAEVSTLLQELFDAACNREDISISTPNEMPQLDPQLAINYYVA